jgi:photosystem II stability/assembly factor-like uncharacterized protein
MRRAHRRHAVLGRQMRRQREEVAFVARVAVQQHEQGAVGSIVVVGEQHGVVVEHRGGIHRSIRRCQT